MTSHTDTPGSSQWEKALFRMSRGGMIALVVIIVLMLAGAGLLAGSLLHRDAPELKTVPQGVSRAPVSRTLLALAPRAAHSRFTAARTGRTQVSGPTPTPTETSSPGPSPSPSPTSGSTIDLGPGLLSFELTPPWTVLGQSETDALFQDGLGDYSYLLVGHTDPGKDASALLIELFPQIITSDHYSGLRTGDIQVNEAGGRLTSAAVVAYTGTWTDNQGSFDVFGNFWVDVRDDGAYLVETAETTPPDSFFDNEIRWRQVIDPAFRSFFASI